MQSWPIHGAKAHLSALAKRAQQQPQPLSSEDEPVAGLGQATAKHRQTQRGESLLAVIRRSRLVAGDALELDRSSDLARDLKL